MDISKRKFGITKNGEQAYLYTLYGKNDAKLEITDFGGTIVSLFIKDKYGALKDIVLGFDNLEDYERNNKYIGATIGRCCNRIKNGKFILNEKEYILFCNNNKNHLHGGLEGFDKKLWQAKIINNTLALSYTSTDGEEGYPGTLNVNIIYSFDKNNTLTIEYFAKSDKDTLCNITNHTYFNLFGYETGDILTQKIQIFADFFMPNDENSIPTGEVLSVKNTPFDFLTSTPIGRNINEPFSQLHLSNGYDQNWLINNNDGSLRQAAFAYCEKSGISLKLETTLSGVQFYTGNYLDGCINGKNNTPIKNRSGFCLETQFPPNAINSNFFEKPILKACDIYHHTTKYSFKGVHSND